MKTTKVIRLCLFAAACLALMPARAAMPLSPEQRLEKLERNVNHFDSVLSASFVAAVICAFWAQNSGRNPWLWFLLGLVFSAFALIALLYKNARDLRDRRVGHGPPRTA